MSNDGGDKAGPQVGDLSTGFSYGDWVEFKLNTTVFGIVVNFDAHGVYYVQLAPSGEIRPFYGETLRATEDDDEVQPGAEDTADNSADNVVINFTEARARAGKGA